MRTARSGTAHGTGGRLWLGGGKQAATITVPSFLAVMTMALPIFTGGTEEISSLHVLVVIVVLALNGIGILRLLTRRHDELGRSVQGLLFLQVLVIANAVFPATGAVEALWWLRGAVPMICLAGFAVFGVTEWSGAQRVRFIYASLLLIHASVVVRHLVQLRSLPSVTVVPVQLLRAQGGHHSALFLLCLAFPLAFQSRSERFLGTRTLGALLVAVALIGLLFGLTRSFWLGGLVAVGFMLLLLRVQVPDLISRFLFAIVPASVLLLVLTASSRLDLRFVLGQRLSRWDILVSSASVSNRVYEARGVLRYLISSPLKIIVGNGIGASFTYWAPHLFGVSTTSGPVTATYTHNYYLYLLFTVGLLGLGAFSFSIGSLLVSGARFVQLVEGPSPVRYALTGLLGALVSLTVTSLAAPQLMSFRWAINFGAVVGLASAIMQDSTDSED